MGARRWSGALVAAAVATGTAGAVVLPAGPVSADQISDAPAQAGPLQAQIQATGQQINALSQQYDQASYQLQQVNGQIAVTQSQIAQTHKLVTSDQARLRRQAVQQYVSAGTSSSVTDMFTADNNA